MQHEQITSNGQRSNKEWNTKAISTSAQFKGNHLRLALLGKLQPSHVVRCQAHCCHLRRARDHVLRGFHEETHTRDSDPLRCSQKQDLLQVHYGVSNETQPSGQTQPITLQSEPDIATGSPQRCTSYSPSSFSWSISKHWLGWEAFLPWLRNDGPLRGIDEKGDCCSDPAQFDVITAQISL